MQRFNDSTLNRAFEPFCAIKLYNLVQPKVVPEKTFLRFISLTKVTSK